MRRGYSSSSRRVEDLKPPKKSNPLTEFSIPTVDALRFIAAVLEEDILEIADLEKLVREGKSDFVQDAAYKFYTQL